MRLRPGAILSLLVLLCAPAPSARAGCSAHYLTPQAQTAARLLAFDSLLLSGSMLPSDGDGERPPSWPKPCSGAFCSGNPAAPFSAAPSVIAEGDGDWAISGRPALLVDPKLIVRLIEDAELAPVDHPSAIFHPPRPRRPRPTI